MGIFERIKLARETYRQEAMRKATTRALQDKLDLEDLRQQKETLSSRQVVRDQLKAEQRAVSDLKHPIIANVRDKIKSGGAASLKGLKTGADKLRAHAAKNKSRYGSAFNTQPITNNSPFSPGNAHLLMGVQTPTKRKSRTRTVTKIVYKR